MRVKWADVLETILVHLVRVDGFIHGLGTIFEGRYHRWHYGGLLLRSLFGSRFSGLLDRA
jgi:hypothetical protein